MRARVSYRRIIYSFYCNDFFYFHIFLNIFPSFPLRYTHIALCHYAPVKKYQYPLTWRFHMNTKSGWRRSVMCAMTIIRFPRRDLVSNCIQVEYWKMSVERFNCCNKIKLQQKLLYYYKPGFRIFDNCLQTYIIIRFRYTYIYIIAIYNK